jgi:Ca2+-transporting ATPase
MPKFHSLTAQEVEQELKTDLEFGLSAEEVQSRLEKFGPNKLESDFKSSSIAKILLRQFYSPLMLMLLGAVVFSLALKEFSDAIVITGAVLFNVLVGLFQESKAERVAQSLIDQVEHECLVIRSSKVEKIKAQYLVPGDILILRAGDALQADVRLFETSFLKIKETMLTGEAVDVAKQTEPLSPKTGLGDRSNMGFAGTFVTCGNGQGIVVGTGTQTQAGQIQELLTDSEVQKTPLQEQIEKLAWIITLMLSVTISLVTLAGILRGIPLVKMMTLAIAIAVAAVPEGLMIAMTVILSIGMSRMLARRALVRDLLSAEILGSVSVVCTDKTGTLTEGNMMLEKIVTLNDSFDPENPRELDEAATQILYLAYKSSDAKVVGPEKFEGDEAEVAILRSYRRAKVFFKNFSGNFERIGAIPFDSANRFSACLCKTSSGQILAAKGSHEKILVEMCIQSPITAALAKAAEELTLDGLRVLAVAKKTGSNLHIDEEITGLEPMGLLCFSDRLRKTAKSTVQTIQNAGIRVVMITGDHKQTALNIAHQVGITPQNMESVLEGHEIEDLSSTELAQRVRTVNVFSRVSPHDKIRIVKAFRASGEVTAMTGDGANDAPALKAADIGLAVGSGSQVSKCVAGIVLLDSNLSTIGKAIEEGRIIFDNIRKVIVYFLADGLAQTAMVIGALIFKLPIPLLPAQILWINFITDGFPSMALTADPGESDIMQRAPRKKHEPIVSHSMKALIFMSSAITNVILFSLYFVLLKTEMPLVLVRTIIFQCMAISTLFYVFSVRKLKNPIWQGSLFSNRWLLLAVGWSIALQLCCWKLEFLRGLLKLAPMQSKYWLLILPISLIKLGSMEVSKILIRNFAKNKAESF